MLFQQKKMIDIKKYGLFFLNLTQFSVVLVDNIFKLIIAFFLIDLGGKGSASQILSTVGAVYVIPFLLLSSLGGTLADRFSKRTITIIIKCLGGLILLSALYVFHIKSSFGCYLLLFLLSTQSALFGPSKYGMIPELVPQQDISKANGYVTAFTYLAIILGTFLGSFLSDYFDKNYFAVISITFLFSLTGIISSFFIPKLKPSTPSEEVSITVFKNTVKVISDYPKKAHLGMAMFASAFFLMMGGFTQLAIIPFAIQILDKTEFIGGYLFLTTALGIAFGSQVVGRLSKQGPNLIFPAFGGVVLGIMMVILGLGVFSMTGTIICLVTLGVAGGFYIVPVDAYIQMTANDEQRGRILGLNNLLGFTGVLTAAFMLYFLSQVLNLEPDTAFAVMGFIYLIFIALFIRRISDRLCAIWLKSNIFKSSPVTIVPAYVNLLIVPEISLKYLKALTVNKTRVCIVTDKKRFNNPSCFIYRKQTDLLNLINDTEDKSELIIIKKSMINFDLKDVKVKVGEIEEIK